MIWYLAVVLGALHTTETIPYIKESSIEAGVHFRVRLSVAGGTVQRNGSVSSTATRIRIIRAVETTGVQHHCNDSLDASLSNGVYAEVADLSAKGGGNSTDSSEADDWEATDGYATFAAPTYDFKICYLNPNYSSEWRVPDSDSDTVDGDIYNVTEASLTWTSLTDDYAAGTWTAFRINGVVMNVTVHALYSDAFKIVETGKLCITEGNGFYYHSDDKFEDSLTTNSLDGSLAYYLGTEDEARAPEGVYSTVIARVKLPAAGTYGICYSSEHHDRYYPGAPGWRYLPLSSTPLSATDTTLIVANSSSQGYLSWQLADKTQHSFASLKIHSTLQDLTRSQSDGTFQAPILTGGDQLRILDSSLLKGIVSLGCWSDVANEVRLNYSYQLGPTSTTRMLPNTDLVAGDVLLTLATLSFSVLATEAWAQLRLPDKGDYTICYRRPHSNWVPIAPELLTVEGYVNITWYLNDTTEGSQAQLRLTSSKPVMNTMPLDPGATATGGVAVKLVAVDESCALAEPVVQAWDAGNREVPWGTAKTWDADSTAVTDVVYMYLTLPNVDARGYRVCIKHGNYNWWAAASDSGDDILYVMPSRRLRVEVRDARAGMLSAVHLIATTDLIDTRPASEQNGEWQYGTIVRLVPNETWCAPTYPDMYENYTSNDLSMPCGGDTIEYCATDEPEAAVADAHVTIPPAGSYAICVKQGTNNWIALHSIDVLPSTTYYLSSMQVVSGTMAYISLRSSQPAVVSHTTSVKLVPIGTPCDRQHIDRSLSLSSTKHPVLDEVTVRLPVSPSILPYSRFTDMCISAGGEAWARTSHIEILPSDMAYLALGVPLEGSTLRIAISSAGTSNTETDSFLLVNHIHYCDVQYEAHGLHGTLGPSHESSLSLVISSVEIPHNVLPTRYRVCYRLGGVWTEVAEGPPSLLPPSYNVHLLNDNVTSISLRTTMTGGVSPEGLDLAGHTILAGSLSTFDITSTARLSATIAKIVVSCSAEPAGSEGTVVMCDGCSNTALVNISVPLEAGSYRKCYLAPSQQWIDLGPVTVVASLYRATYTGPRIYVYDNSYDASSAPSPSLVEGNEHVSLVRIDEDCSHKTRIQTRGGSGDTLPLSCLGSDCVHVLVTGSLELRSVMGSFKVCFKRTFSYGGRIPSNTYVAIPVTPVLNVGTGMKLQWYEDPVAGYNISWPLRRSDLLSVRVMLVWPDGSRASVDDILTVTLSQNNRSATLATHGECNDLVAPDYGWPVYNTHEYLVAGVASFHVRILEDCLSGCDLSVKYGSASITATFYTEAATVTALALSTVNLNLEAPLVSAEGNWAELIIIAKDNQQYTVAGTQSQIMLAPNTTELGTGSFRCRNKATQSACGAVPSPGPFSVTLDMNGSIAVQIGTTGRLTSNTLTIQIYLSTNTAIKRVVQLSVQFLNVVSVSMTDLSGQQDITTLGGVSLHTLEWAPVLPSSAIVGHPGSYMLAGIPYLCKFRASGEDGVFASQSDLEWLVSTPILKITLVEENTTVPIAEVPVSKSGGTWTATLNFPGCGRYDGMESVPCVLVFEIVNSTVNSSTHKPVRGTMHMWVREVATKLAITSNVSRIDTPLYNQIIALSSNNIRDWWFHGRVVVAEGRQGWHNVSLVDPAHVDLLPEYRMSHGITLTQGLSVTSTCSPCIIEALSPELSMASGLVVTEPDVVGMQGSYTPSLITTNKWIVFTVQSVDSSGTATVSDSSEIVLSAEAGNITIHSNSSTRMSSSLAVFIIMFHAPCTKCTIFFNSGGSPAWATDPTPWVVEVDVNLYPAATQLSMIVGSNAVQTGPYAFMLPKGVAVLILRAVDEDGAVDPRARNAVTLVNPLGLLIEISADALTRGEVYVRVSIFQTCAACRIVLSVAGLGEASVVVTIPAEPNTMYLEQSTSTLYPFQGLTIPPRRTVNITLTFFERSVDGVIPATPEAPFTITLTSACGQVLRCEGCTMHPARQSASILVGGTKGNVTCDIDIAVMGMSNTSHVRWLPSRPAVSVQILDTAPYGGEWLVRTGNQVLHAPLYNWSYTMHDSAFIGQPFPLWVEVIDADGLPVVGQSGTMSLEVATRKGCGAPTMSYYGVRLLGAHLPLINATRQVTLNYPAPVLDGRALFWVTFNGGCQECVLRARLTPTTAQLFPNNTGLSKPLVVKKMTGNEIAFFGSGQVVHKAVNESVNATLLLLRCTQSLCYHSTAQSGQLTAYYEEGSVREVMYNSTVFMKAGVASVTAVFTRPCTMCRVAVHPSTELSVSGTISPWVYNVRAAFDKVVVVRETTVEGRVRETLSITVAAIDAGGNIATDYGNATYLKRTEGGGDGDGGILHWTNARYLGRDEMAYQQEGEPLWAPLWTQGTQTWRLHFSAACSRCLLTIAGLDVVAVIHARAERLLVDSVSTDHVLVEELVAFKVSAIDSEGNVDESFGNNDVVHVLVQLEGTKLVSNARQTMHPITNGVVWVSTAFTRPIRLASVIAEIPALNLTNRAVNSTLLVVVPETTKYTPPVLTVDTVGRDLRLLHGVAMGVLGKPFVLTIGVTDASPDLNVAYSMPALNVTFSHDCGTATAASTITLVEGTAKSTVVVRSRPPSGVCHLRYSAPHGSLISTVLTVAITINTHVTCTQLTLSDVPEYVVALLTTLLIVKCTDSNGYIDTTQVDTVYLNTNCTEPQQAQLISGEAVFRMALPPERCMISVTYGGFNDSFEVISQQPATLVLMRDIATPLAVNTPVGVELALQDANSTLVRGVHEHMQVSIVGADSRDIEFVIPCTPHIDGEWHGMWGCWIRVTRVFSDPIQILLSVVGHSVRTKMISTAVVASQLVLLGATPPMYRVAQRPVAFSVMATDLAGLHANASDALVRIRHVDAINIKPFVNQSTLVSSQPLTKRMNNGTVTFVVFWKGSDGNILLSVLGMGTNLEPLPPISLTMQTIDHYEVATSAVANHPHERTSFDVYMYVMDKLGNVVVGDNGTHVETVWLSAERTQRVFIENLQDVTTGGVFKVSITYDRPSVNTTIGFIATGVLPQQAVWSLPFTVSSWAGAGLVLPFAPPLLSFVCGTCSYSRFNATAFEGVVSTAVTSQVVVTGVCTTDRANCTLFNTTDQYLRPVQLLSISGAVVEFTFNETDRDTVWGETALLEELLTNTSSFIYMSFLPQSLLQVTAQPGSPRPEPLFTPIGAPPVADPSPFDGAAAPYYSLCLSSLWLLCFLM